MKKLFSQNISLAMLGILLGVAMGAVLPVLGGENTVYAEASDFVAEAQCKESGNTQCVQACTDPAAGVANPCAPLDTCVGNCNVVNKYLNPFIRVLATLAGIAVVIGIIVGGIQYASSEGDPQKAAAGKKHIKVAVIALVGFFFLFAFLRFIAGSGV